MRRIIISGLCIVKKEWQKMPSPHLNLEIEPNFVKAHNNLGVIYYEANRLDEAIEEA